MKLYHELAAWWPVLSAPGDYEEEAGLYWEIISRHRKDIHDALELGSGGGNNAFHLKKRCRFTLTDISPAMIGVSRKLNPECEHMVGDMRDIRLDRLFDLVFIHDAIMHITTEQDLEKVFRTAKAHLKEDGVLFIAPDFFKETFTPGTSHGGHDEASRSLRYLEWTYDKDPSDHIVETEYVYLLKDGKGEVTCVHDTAIEGIFSKRTWEELLVNTGFAVSFEAIPHSELEPDTYFGIVALRK